MYEGAPNWPEPDRFWKLIEEYGVTRLLHGADGDSSFHPLGRRVSKSARSVFASVAWHGGRADQPGGMDRGITW